MDREEIQRALDAFEQNPSEALRRLPEKRDATGRTIIGAPTAFSEEDIRSLDFVRQKDAARKRLYTVAHGETLALIEVGPGWEHIGSNDNPENLVDTLRYEKPADIDAAGLASAQLSETPWSSDYWPTHLGLVGRRYADPKFPASRNWKKNFEHIEAHPFLEIVESGDGQAIERLAPSEKYDLLVGDANGSLTAAMWDEGKSYAERNVEVEAWMGICDGWAAASYMLPRPRRDVTVLAADGKTKLRFYPDDIKALASLLWAKARTVARFIGGRSNDKKPKTDEGGRLISPEAFDTNPGTFHLVCVNQVGVSKRSFIMDSTYDYEVWNQPITAYEYHYFNPQDMQAAPDLRSATIARGDFTKDRFRQYRGAETAAFVGVYMRVRYVGETRPSHVPTDGPERDLIVTVDYTYDLELAADGRIIGGEWYKNAHPDFLWTPPPGARALTPADYFARGEWDPAQPLPALWRRAAFRASPSMLPLAKIVERLIELANT
jgi:hypothetical protein